MIMSGIALALVLLLRFGPNTPLLRALRHCLVERLAAWLAGLQRHHAIMLILLPALVMTGGELFLLFGPEFVMWYAANLAFYVDAMLVSSLLAAATTARSISRQVRARVHLIRRRFVPTPRSAPRQSRTRTLAAASADNDDHDRGTGLKLAA